MKTNVAEIESVMAAAKRQFLIENLKDGEVYVGLLLGEKGSPDEHIFLLPETLENADWDKAMKWAAKIGGSLPTRREQRLLIANAKSAFMAAWYWSCEQHADYPTDAWGQDFDGGTQYYNRKSYAGRAVAVRRLPIQ